MSRECSSFACSVKHRLVGSSPNKRIKSEFDEGRRTTGIA